MRILWIGLVGGIAAAACSSLGGGKNKGSEGVGGSNDDGGNVVFTMPSGGGGNVNNLPPPPNCGDGQLGADEACDDGIQESGDGCAKNCLSVEPGFSCSPPGVPCHPVAHCGDGL